MNDLMVLRALARLSRTRRTVDNESIALRTGGTVEETRGALGRLSRASLVERSATGVRLTFQGLAVAVAFGGERGTSIRVAPSRPGESGVLPASRPRSKRRAA